MHDVWTTDNGLPQDTIWSIVQTRDGYLWLGTEGGLVRFDGVRFMVFDKENTPEIKSSSIYALLEDREGSLWIGTSSGGLSRLKDGKFSSYTTKDGLSSDIVECLYGDRDGSLWIGTSAGLNHLRDGRVTSYTTKNGLSNDIVRSLYQDREGSLWIGTSGGGLNRLKDGKFTAYTTKDGLSNGIVNSILQDREGLLWIGTADGGLNRLKDGKFTVYTTKEGLSNVNVRALYQDLQGSLWIGTWGGGLDRFQDGKFAAYTTKDGLSADQVLSFYEDHEGSLWIGTGSGLNRFQNGKFTTYSSKEGLSNEIVMSLYQDQEGALLIGTVGGGLYSLKNGRFAAYTNQEGLSNDTVNSIFQDVDGILWIGTDGGGVKRLMHGRITVYTTKEGLSNDIVNSIYQDREGSLWIGTSNGLNRFKDGKFTVYTTKEGLSNNIVWYLYQDKEGSLWIGTRGGGLNRFRSGRFTAYTNKNGLSNDYVTALYQDGEGSLWIGTDGGGLDRFKDGKLTSYTTREGLFDDKVFVILEDSKGHLWMSCNKGIFLVSKKELDDLDAGKAKRIHSISFGKADGMKSQECQGGSQPAGWKTADGKLFFATVKGVAAIDPEHIKVNEGLPPVIVEYMVGGGIPLWASVALAGFRRPAFGSSGRLEIPPGSNKFEFQYTALSFLVPEKVLFKYKLEGFDNDWVDAGTRRTAYYTNIPPGNYTFRVKACNNDGVWNEEGAAFAFRLMPHFYQTWWFYGLCFLTAASVARAAYQVRIRSLKARETELIRVVEEKTRDLREANERIEKLQESAPAALDNLAVWSRVAAEDIARAIGATDIEIWTVEENALKLLSGMGTKPPSLENLRSGKPFTHPVNDAEDTTIPLTGLSGELHGAMIITGANINWGETEKRLVTSFAHQLGGTLETQHLAGRLARAEERKAMKLQEMHEHGIHTLQVCPSCGRCYDDLVESCEDDGAKLQAPRTLPYCIHDRYRLIRMLGEGGMGAVYQAFDEALNRSVAVKIIKAELLNDPSMRIRLEREARTVARIQHPGVVSIYDFGEIPDGSAFLVMELLEGVDLAKILEHQGPGTPVQVASLLSQVGDALSAAHSHGVVHRDLKPANLFMIPSGSGFQVKVVDFGLAKSLGEESHLTATGMLLGSPAYMSPEQIRQQPLEARSDLFSLAALSYELLTGVVVFGAEHVSDVLTKVLLENPPPISSRLAGVPPELDLAFSAALEKAPEKRPISVSAWLEQIVPLLTRMPAGVPGWRPQDICEVKVVNQTDDTGPAKMYQPIERAKFTAEHWRLIETIFNSALELPADQRSAYLDEVCKENPALRQKIDELLTADHGDSLKLSPVNIPEIKPRDAN